MSSSKNHSNAKSKDNHSRSRGKSVLSVSASNDPMMEASINKHIKSKSRVSVNRSSQDKRRDAFPSASVGSVSDVLINAKSAKSRQMIKAKTNIVLSNSKNSKTRSRQNSSKVNGQTGM